MPRAPGHTLVLPKAPARNILDVTPDDLAHVMQGGAEDRQEPACKVFGADGVTIQQFNESAGGQVVFHLHVHVIPRKDGVALKPPASFKEAPEVLAEQARRSSRPPWPPPEARPDPPLPARRAGLTRAPGPSYSPRAGVA